MSSRPAFHIYLDRVTQNLERLTMLEQQSGIKILHTLKSIHHPTLLEMLSTSISGASVSSASELQLAKDAKSQHIHLYAPAFSVEEFSSLATEANTISLNSLSQWEQLHNVQASMGLRLNPMLESSMPAYCNPNLSHSHLGVDFQKFLEVYSVTPHHFTQLRGLHFHALFRAGVEGMASLLEHIQIHYQAVLPQLQWINLGGGHALTDPDYDVDSFFLLVKQFNIQYPQIQLYIEPGEATFKNSTEFVTTILDIIPHKDMNITILNTSTETHLLDCAIHNIHPKVSQSTDIKTPYLYKLCGNSCLQGDIISSYYFETPLQIGDTITFQDMASYTMSKMTQFNGTLYPKIHFITPKEHL